MVSSKAGNQVNNWPGRTREAKCPYGQLDIKALTGVQRATAKKEGSILGIHA
jgi:hypothetical protein